MRESLLARTRLAVLTLAVGSLLGSQCDPGGNAELASIAPRIYVSSIGTYSPLMVEIAVDSPTPIQAFELGLRWDPEMLTGTYAFPHSDFDDDAAFFSSPRFEAGKLDRVIDLRHGGEGAAGTFGVAVVRFFTRGETGSTSIQVTGAGLAGGDGSEPPLRVLPLTITIEP